MGSRRLIAGGASVGLGVGLAIVGPHNIVEFAERQIPLNAIWPHAASMQLDQDVHHVTPAGSAEMPCRPGSVINHVATSRKEVALTIDDGPSPTQMPAILDILRKTGAQATFFFVGNRLQSEQGKGLARQALQEGHEVGVHSYSHRIYDHNRRTGEWQKAGDVNAAQQPKAERAFVEAFGAVPYAYRAPGFKYTDALRRVVRESKQCFIDMSYDGKLVDSSQDGTSSPQKALSNIKKKDDVIIGHLAPGNIILVHDAMKDQPDDGGKNRQRQNAAAHILYLIRGIEEKGYTVVSVETLLRHAQSDAAHPAG